MVHRATPPEYKPLTRDELLLLAKRVDSMRTGEHDSTMDGILKGLADAAFLAFCATRPTQMGA